MTVYGASFLISLSESAIEIILFGGEPNMEPVFAQGPFVMNTQHEISQAYNNFYNGIYGKVDYSWRNETKERH